MSLNENTGRGDNRPDGELMDRILEREIAEHCRTEKELRDTRGFLENLMETLPSAIVVVNERGAILHWNKSAETLTGTPTGQAVGEDVWETLPFLRGMKDEYERALRGAASEDMPPLKIQLGDEERAVALSMYPLKSEGAREVVIKIDDITEILKKDEYVRQSQKMDIVGNLASGLAHDFNNVIGALDATISSIKFSLARAKSLGEFREAVREDFEVLGQSLRHGSEMVEQLRSLGKKKEQPFSRVDLAEIVSKTSKICRKTFPDCIDINTCLPAGEKAFVMAYPTQLDQMLLNLCVNASHAMTDMRGHGERHGGTMTLILERGNCPDAERGSSGCWLLKVADTGVGMDKATAEKIFDPFFTTKDKSKGTGLGLSMVYNIVRTHKGRVQVETEPGKGAVFKIYLPASGNEEEAAKIGEGK